MVQQTKGIFDGLNLKPDIKTFLESEIDGPQHDLENAKTPGGGCRVVLRKIEAMMVTFAILYFPLMVEVLIFYSTESQRPL